MTSKGELIYLRKFGSALTLAVSLMSGMAQSSWSAVLFPAPGHTASETWPPGVPIRLCAIRVEFPEDFVTGTTGNGQMESWFPDTLRIDPLPHDKAYFEDHLRFLEHYYATASKGAVFFTSLDVYPASDTATYLLGNPMWHYNYNSDETLLNQRLVELFVEATQLAAADVNFTNYDAILIFHAGVGKDFNFGYDFTPFDIPSAYISEQDIQNYTVPPGVTRGLILPEGENQQEALDFGVELSLNGIMIKLFGNWLGLPDLFNTETGLSGIGRWGMMDQGSGNLGALVPAFPDAWSRAFMQWQNITAVLPSRYGDTVRVARFDVAGAPEIIKLPITPSEYYLLENRDADADSVGFVELRDRVGRIMRMTANGDLTIDSEFQIAVSASHYDFGIPGSGILIWHIDEDVIETGLPTNTVNSNPDHRGVDLVEADAAQDIGEEYGFASPGSGAELGVREDAWYAGNEAHRAANRGVLQVRFTDGAYPPALLYDGAFTYYELTNFSPVDSVMSFRLLSTAVAPGFPVVLDEPAEWAPADLDGDGWRELYLVSGDSLFRADSANGFVGLAAVPNGVTPSKLLPIDIDGDGREELLLEGSHVGIVEWDNGSLNVRTAIADWSSANIRVYPATATDGTDFLLAVGSNTDSLSSVTAMALYTMDLTPIDIRPFASVSYPEFSFTNIESFPATRFVIVGQSIARAMEVTPTALVDLWQIDDTRIQPEVTVLAEPGRRTVFIEGYGIVNATDGLLICAYQDCIAPGVDWDGDGIPEGGGLNGTSSVTREDAPPIDTDTTWVIDLNVNGDPDLLGLARAESLANDTLYTRWIAAKHVGGLFAGFPMAVSGVEARIPFQWTDSNNLFFVSEYSDSSRYYYSVVKLPVLAGSGERFPYQEELNIINVGELRPQVHAREDWLYCWPNPASSVSHIRLTKAYPTQASVKVFDLSGRQVAELSGSSNIAGAFEILWDVTQVESGMYVGQVNVSGGGASDQAEIKIAVVK